MKYFLNLFLLIFVFESNGLCASSFSNTYGKPEPYAQKRERLWNEIHFAYKKMNIRLEKAETYAFNIKDLDARDFVDDVIKGCIAGIAGKSLASMAIGSALGAISFFACEYSHYCTDVRNCLTGAQKFAYIAESLEHQLWCLNWWRNEGKCEICYGKIDDHGECECEETSYQRKLSSLDMHRLCH